jgi:hypothetical protein
MIEELSEEQTQVMYDTRDKWLNVFNSLKMDKEKTIKYIQKLYEIAGLKKPEVIFCDSPLSMQKKANELNGNSSNKLEYYQEAYYGRCDDLYWIAFYDFFEQLGIVKNELFNEIRELADCGLFSSIQFDKVCLACKPPIYIKRDDKGRLHCPDGYAIEFEDGYALSFLHGVYIEPELFNKVASRTITASEIIQIKNTEQRTAILQVVGFIDVLEELGYEIIDELETGYSEFIDSKIVDKLIQFEIDGIKVRGFWFTDYSTGKQGIELVEISRDGNWEINTVKEALAWRCGFDDTDFEVVAHT